jgi:choice-of-anchor A domain-containing protein
MGRYTLSRLLPFLPSWSSHPRPRTNRTRLALDRLDDRTMPASLGLAAEYNALVFGNFTVPNGTDTEGRLAIAGTATFLGNYALGAPLPDSNPTGAQLPLDPTRDTLIVGGDLTNAGGISWTVNGNAVYQGTYTGVPLFNQSGTTRQQSPILLSETNGNAVTSGGRSFADLRAELEALSAAWATSADRGIAAESRGQFTLTLVGTDPVLNVFNLTAEEWGGTDVVRTITAPAGSTVLVNVSGQSVTVSGGDLALIGVDREYVLLNFFEATTFSSTLSDIRGSVLAPFASATFDGGNLEGNAIFGGNVIQGAAAEFHNFRFRGDIPVPSVPTVPTLPPVGPLPPLPGGGGIIGGGGGGAGAGAGAGAAPSKRDLLGSAMGQTATAPTAAVRTAAALNAAPNFAMFNPSSARQLVFTAVAQDRGGLVRVFDFSSGNERFRLTPFGAGFAGRVNVTTGDVTGDGIPDVIAATGAGTRGVVRVFNGGTGALVRTFQPFGPGYTRGVTVAAADLNGDGFAEVVVGAGPGAAPWVKVFNGATGALTTQFLAFGAANRSGLRVAAGDVNRDGTPDVLVTTATGPVRLAGFSGASLTSRVAAPLFRSFVIGPVANAGGAWVSAGDINGDGFADVAVGLGAGAAARVISFSGQSLAAGGMGRISTCFVDSAAGTGDTRVTVADLDGDGRAEVLTTFGGAAAPTACVMDPLTGTQRTRFRAFNPSPAGGIYVG